MCNLYSHRTSASALHDAFAGLTVAPSVGNLGPGRVYPDQPAPVIRHKADHQGLELAMARWGMPTPSQYLKTARDPGVTNVRNTSSPHWRRWLGPEHRCLVPLEHFAEPRGKGRGNQWFAPVDPDVQMYFAGIEVRDWESVRKVKDGETTDDLFAFLTTDPNAEVAQVHPKAMPVILTAKDELETWLHAEWDVARTLQRPLPDDSLVLIA